MVLEVKMDKFKQLLGSRKFWAAILGVVGVLLVDVAGLSPESAELVTNAIMAIIAAYILGTAVEDGLRG